MSAPRALAQVDVVDPDGLDSDEYLAFTRLRVGVWGFKTRFGLEISAFARPILVLTPHKFLDWVALID